MAASAASPVGTETDLPFTFMATNEDRQPNHIKYALYVTDCNIRTCERQEPECRLIRVRGVSGNGQELDVAREERAVRATERENTSGLRVRRTAHVQETGQPERELWLRELARVREGLPEWRCARRRETLECETHDA